MALYETGTAQVPGIVAWTGSSAKFVTRDSLTLQWSASPEVVENVFPVGTVPSIAVDSGGVFHVVFFENGGANLRHATRVSGNWIGEYVDTAGSVGDHHSIVIDSNDVVHIVYYDSTNGDLKYATVAP